MRHRLPGIIGNVNGLRACRRVPVARETAAPPVADVAPWRTTVDTAISDTKAARIYLRYSCSRIRGAVVTGRAAPHTETALGKQDRADIDGIIADHLRCR